MSEVKEHAESIKIKMLEEEGFTPTVLAARYVKLVDFIKYLIIEFDDDISDRERCIKFKEFSQPLFKAEFICILTKIKCEELLKEINE